MKMNYGARFGLTLLAIVLSAYFWWHDGVDRGLDLKGGASLTYQLDFSTLPAKQHEDSLLNTVRVIEERINNLGLKDVKVDALPPDQFEVQFPGQESRDVERIRTILTRLGQLEFRMLATEPEETAERQRRDRMGSDYPGPQPSGDMGYRWVPQRSPGTDEAGNPLPAGPDRLIEVPEADEEAEVARLTALLEEDEIRGSPTKTAEVQRQLDAAKEALQDAIKRDVFTGSDLSTGALGIAVDTRQPGWIVQFAMSDRRRTDFADFTKRNLERPMGIVIDGALVSYPTINDVLSGNSQISGGGYSGFQKQEAEDLVTVLRSGSLDVGITLQSEFAIGPSLGESSIRLGLLATGIGFGLVLLFMVATYFFPGMVAIFALLMNLLMIMGALAFFQAELSLPGIAGVILTVGMAVDANILVFERIREERALGKSLVQAVKAGYDRAFITIVDANVTTLFVAVVLYVITTGTVRGFAATLVFGILSSMFTALFVTRTIFGWLIDKGLVTEMKMPNLIGKMKLSYMKIRLPAIAVSIVLIVLGFLAFEETGDEKYDIEFLAGFRSVVHFKEPVAIKDVKERIGKEYSDAAVVSIKSDRAEAAALDLSRTSDSFQITIGSVDKADLRERVLGFLEREFADDLVPEGLIPIEDAADIPEGFVRYRLNFQSDIPEAELKSLFASVPGVAEMRIFSLAGPQAFVDVKLDVTTERFIESLNNQIASAERKLTEPFPVKSFVDPKTAEQHRDDALKAVVISLIFQIIYIYFRFHGAAFGFAAVIALLHDVLITLGAIAVFTHFGLVNVKISLPIIAAILTLIGYSMNDTIVVFDRIRENLGRTKMNLSEIIDLSVNQTMSRSIRTSLTTIAVVVVLFIVNYGQAASVLEGFSFVLIVGIITGTYSSIFVASPMLLFLPWHYLRGKQYFRFWGLVGLSLVGILASLFGTSVVTWILVLAYPIYFLVDLALWLVVKDPDRALNRVLRAQAA